MILLPISHNVLVQITFQTYACQGDSGGPMTVTRRNLDRGRGMNFLV